MVRKILCVIMSITVVVAFSTSSFAMQSLVSGEVAGTGNSKEIELDNANDVSDYLESYIDETNINEDIALNKDGYHVDGQNVELLIPEDAKDGVQLELGKKDVSMSLPGEVGDAKGELSESGTVVYDNSDEGVTLSIHAFQEKGRSGTEEGFQAILLINSLKASREYAFDHKLPAGWKMIFSDEYEKKCFPGMPRSGEKNSKREVYIVDKNYEIQEIIEPAWARDANNISVPTYYKIQGNKLIQVINFNKNHAFPIVADPKGKSSKHPDKYTTTKLNEKGVKQIRNRYSGKYSFATVIAAVTNNAVSIGGFAAAFFAKKAKAKAIGTIMGPAGAAWSGISICNEVYDYKEYRAWNKMYKKMHNNKKYNYITIKYKWKWHGGKKTYYPSGRAIVSFTKK